ncbi:hypothetical protein HDU76_011411 [Blyttiomyces sp. JEL0837]|nr:hypothetical protein HDU76_011411 [Blyttiomyces sp. JEL0837]
MKLTHSSWLTIAVIAATSATYTASAKNTDNVLIIDDLIDSPSLLNEDPCSGFAAQAKYILYNDPDRSVDDIPVQSAREAIACFNSFPIDRATRLAQVKELKKYYRFYPFVDIVKNSTEPQFPSSVDIFASLDEIANDNTITTEYVVHSKINILMASLQDAHTSYDSACFRNAYFFQPFALTPVYDPVTGSPKIKILGSVFDQTRLFSEQTVSERPFVAGLRKVYSESKKLWDFDTREFTNWEVHSINGVDAVEFIQQHADMYSGLTKTPEGRFNAFVASRMYVKGNYTFRDGLFYARTGMPYNLPMDLTYVLVDRDPVVGETRRQVVATWASVFYRPGDFTGGKDMYEQFCAKGKGPQARRTTYPWGEISGSLMNGKVSDSSLRSKFFVNDGINNQDVIFDQNVGKKKIDTKKLAEAFESKLNDGLVNVKDQLRSLKSEFFATMAAGLAALEEAGVNNLILELSSNGGGDIVLGYVVAEYLFNGTNPLPYDARLDEPAKLALSYMPMRDLYNLVVYQGSKNLTEDPDYLTRNGVTTPHTRKFTFDCDPMRQDVQKTLPGLKKGWSKDNVFILSNGLCGSTCAVFSRVLRDQLGVRSITYGGGHTNHKSGISLPFQPSAFEGGMVSPFESLYSMVELAITNSTLLSDHKDAFTILPWDLPLAAGGSCALFEIYSPKGDGGLEVPAEWVPYPAEDGLKGVDTLVDTVGIWERAVEAVDKFKPPKNKGSGVVWGGKM